MFTTVPYGLTAQEINAWLYYGGGLELWRELYAQFDLYPIPGGNTGVQMAGWFKEEIESLEDLQDLRMRIPGLGGAVMDRAGVEVVSVPGGQIFTALQAGTVDAVEWVGPYNDLTLGLHTAAEYYYYPGWQEPGPAMETLVNMDAWHSLPEDLQLIVETATKAMNVDMLAEYTARNNAALNELVEEHGVKLRKLPDDVLQRLREISEEVIAEIAKESPMAKRIHASLKRFQREVSGYHAISEHAYLNAREQTSPSPSKEQARAAAAGSAQP